ncbi:multidrug effflux MFS transporter [Vibrio agarivorans]|uniref:multidrug effflux MFS transporter n=1 Tax=Vibrio agarivorans TaxID=153622 RepID=UPI0025B4004C|nr:multidrug effflux MFS transporter [Vibrio agarivorans]MDN3659984.1 multidrug effflux MFS transporter [Vibrio agarivorans]
MPGQIHTRVLALAVLIISIGQLSMGLVFPSLPWIAKDFSVSLDQAQLLVSVYLLGFGPSQFIYGPVSDALGRKKVLLFGLTVALAGLLSIILFHHSFEALVLGRLLQGIGTGCCAVLARATIRDSHSGDQLAKALGYIAMAASITPLFAPVIGGFINHHFGWMMVFVSLFGYVFIAWLLLLGFFDETRTQRSKVPSPKAMLLQYQTLLKSKYFVSFAMITWLNFSLMITTISVMPFIMQNQIGMDSDEYALWALIPAIGMLLGTSLCNRLRPQIGTQKMLYWSPVLHLCAAIWLIFCPLEPLYVMIGQLFMILGNGIALPCAQTMLLQPYKKQAGAAAAMAGGGQMVASAVVSMGLTQLGLQFTWQLAIVIIVFACITLTNITRGFKAQP